jgi:hypothetical protein
VGSACSTYGREERCMQNIVRQPKKRRIIWEMGNGMYVYIVYVTKAMPGG